MDVRRILVAAAFGLLLLPALAGAASHPTATGVRVGDHPAFVRVVVDFAGGAVKFNETQAIGLTKTDAGVGVFHATVAPGATGRSAYGVTARLVQSRTQLTVQLAFAASRIKYLSYAVVTGNRLAIDLWKGAPPTKAAEIRKGAGGCLALSGWHVTPGLVTVSGRERNIFEHMFQVVVRGANGTVLSRQTGVQGHGSWSTHVHYRAAHRQSGTLEAVAFSAKDGALACIAQARVTLPAS